MQQLSNTELENLRHLIMEEQVTADKAGFFAQQVANSQLKSHLDRKYQMCRQNVQKLSQFLSH